ncbi:hypothetical protein ACOBQJ_02195 [Pelotomaculum propionicicum]|uniref:hypothetical protein n=1 Tax=Pelotomaculum propionicicum TaxID=258475 RepID=UPI003B8201A8
MRDKKFDRQSLLLAAIIIAVTLFCSVYFILVPQVKSYGLAKKDLAGDSDRLLNARAAAASINSESDRLNKAREDYEIKCEPFRKVTRDGSDIIFLGLAAANGNIAAAEIIPGDIIEKQHTLELPVKVVLRGDYRSLLDCCRELESNNSANLLEIRSLKIEAINQTANAKGTGSAANAGTVKATLGIVMFSVKNPEGKLYLEEMSKWLTGRGDVFRPAVSAAPAPDPSSYLDIHSPFTQNPFKEVKPAEPGKTVHTAKP